MNVSRTKLTLMITEKMFESRFSAAAPEKYVSGKTSRKDSCVVLRHGGTCTKSVLRDVANWRTKIQSSV